MSADKLAELRARKAAAEARIAESSNAPDAELARAEREAADAEAIADAVASHGPVGESVEVIYTRLGCVIVKAPTAARFNMFRDLGEGQTADDVRSFVKSCLVHPDGAGFDAIVMQQPAVVDRCGNAACELAGAVLKSVVGKR